MGTHEKHPHPRQSTVLATLLTVQGSLPLLQSSNLVTNLVFTQHNAGLVQCPCPPPSKLTLCPPCDHAPSPSVGLPKPSELVSRCSNELQCVTISLVPDPQPLKALSSNPGSAPPSSWSQGTSSLAVSNSPRSYSFTLSGLLL